MASAIHVDRYIDAKGQMCPMPIMTLARIMSAMEPGQVIAVAATDAGAKRNIPAWCEKTAATLLDSTEEQGVFTFYVRKAE
ncbi:MAG TPA: sulfurtransferase TusA family protein [Ktedonobacterales bacterium]|nr:sulfurtransferase TusA family protein [Ktedonobacterales bacterium]